MKYRCALVTVQDMARSRALYEGMLQQVVAADMGENLSFEGGFALHQRDHFSSLLDGREIRARANSFELYFEHDDVLGIQELLKREGFEFLHPAREQPWRQMVLRFYDYDGTIVEIGESLEHLAYRLYLEGKALEDISRITYLPIEEVSASITKYSQPKAPH